MKKIKFIHCSDIHLDTPFTSLGSRRELCILRRQELRDSFRQIVETAGKMAADFLFISGDLYEQSYTAKGTIHFINSLFSGIPSTEVVLLPGNHDPYAAGSFYSSSGWAPNVHILNPGTPCRAFDRKGVRVYGAGFRNTVADSLFSPGFTFNKSFINIMLFHGTVDMAIDEKQWNSCSSRELCETGVDYVAAGHFHNRLDDIGGYGIVYNPGSPEPLGFDEEGVHGFYSGSVEKEERTGSRLTVNFIPNNKRFYRRLEVDIGGCSSNEEAALQVSAGTTGFDCARDLFSVVLKGYVEEGFGVDLRELAAILGDKFAFVKIKDETRPDYDIGSLAKEPGIRGQFVGKVLERLDKASGDRERKLLYKAMYYGLEALEGRLKV